MAAISTVCFLALMAAVGVLARPKDKENVAGVAVFVSSNGNNTEHHVQYLTSEEAEALFQQNQQHFLQQQQQIAQTIQHFSNPAAIFNPDFLQQVFPHFNPFNPFAQRPQHNE